MVIQGEKRDGINYESMYDFKDPVEIAGIKIPSLWMHNLLRMDGVEEGENKIENFRINVELEDNFWQANDLNFGTVNFRDSVLTGNVIETFVHPRLKIMMMVTNIRLDDMKKLNIEQHDDLSVSIGDSVSPGLYFPDKSINPPRNKFKSGMIFVGDIDAPYVGFFMWDKKYREKYENKTPALQSVKITKNVESE